MATHLATDRIDIVPMIRDLVAQRNDPVHRAPTYGTDSWWTRRTSGPAARTDTFSGGVMVAVIEDYRRWRALGAGGLPANPAGWLVTTMLRPWGRDTLAVDTPSRAAPGDFTLPPRRGDRPEIAPYPIPHRELQTVTDPGRIRALADRVAAFGADSSGPMVNSTSRFERRGDALFVRDPTTAAPWIARARGEVAHVHGMQGSLHVVADPADVPEIITRGWGERHPLAGRPVIGLPDSYLFLYAPRDEIDQEQLERIIDRVVATAR